MIDIKNLKLSFGEKVLFKGINLKISDNARIGIVGSNGAGKTTLLKILAKKLNPDDGIINLSKNLTVGYLPQDLIELEPVPLMQYLKLRAGISEIENKLHDIENKLSNLNLKPDELNKLLNDHSRYEKLFETAGGFSFEATALKILHGLGFKKGDEFKNCSEFSGGWKMRITIAALLTGQYNALLLDEPTNHLDTESMEWLENWLRTFKGAVIAVSHDQRFLENIADNIAELEHGNLNLYNCGYDEYLILSEQNRELLEKNYIRQQNEINRIEKFITRFRYKATKAAQVQSRIKQLEKINKIELANKDRVLKFNIPEAPPSGREVLKVENLCKSYDDLCVFKNLNFKIERGERVALVGINGAGKSTLLRLLSLNEEPTSGIIKYGHNVKFSYYSQESAKNINYQNTIWQEACSVKTKLNDIERKNLLGAFLFSGDDINKRAEILSGGEKARLSLYKLMLEETNFLILDEPTNHLDQNTREIVERALLKYQGTLLIVSHDRHFLDVLAERVLEIRDGNLYDYQGNYSWFLEKREEDLNNLNINNVNAAPEKNKKINAQVQNNNNKNNLREIKKNINNLEKIISECEIKIKNIDLDLCKPEILKDSNKVQELMITRNNLELDLKNYYSEWENLSENLEQ